MIHHTTLRIGCFALLAALTLLTTGCEEEEGRPSEKYPPLGGSVWQGTARIWTGKTNEREYNSPIRLAFISESEIEETENQENSDTPSDQHGISDGKVENGIVYISYEEDDKDEMEKWAYKYEKNVLWLGYLYKGKIDGWDVYTVKELSRSKMHLLNINPGAMSFREITVHPVPTK